MTRMDNEKAVKLYNELHEEHFDFLVKLCIHYVGNDSELRHNAEDWVQEAFWRAVMIGDDFVHHKNKLGWLINTCKHYADNDIKRRRVRAKNVGVYLDAPKSQQVEDVTARVDKWAQRVDTKDLLAKVTSVLTEKEYAIYQDYFIEGMSENDVAGKHEKPVSAVKATVRRIRNKGKKLLSGNKFMIFLVCVVSFLHQRTY